MRESLTDITVLLDRSGSMSSMKSDVIGGFDAFITKQKEASGDANVTLIQFDCENPQEIVYMGKPVKEVPKLTLHPRGSTPLRDALGLAIVKTGERFSLIPEAERPAKVIFMVVTDGYENSSHEYTQERVKEMVKHQTEAYKWDFIFLGANIDSFAQGSQLGIQLNTTADFTAKNAVRAFNVSSDNIALYRSTGAKSDLSYTKAQRDSLVDDE